MTAAAKPPFKEYLENGVTVAYPVPFRFNQPGHVTAQRIAVDGAVTVLAYGVDYSVSGGTTDSGGTLTVAAAGANGVRLQIRRVTPRDQSMNYATSDTFPAESHEGALDKAMLIDQEQDEAIGEVHGRALMVPIGETAPPIPPRAALKGRFAAFDLDGNIYGSYGTGADAGLREDLAELGDVLNTYNPGGAGAVPTSFRARMQRDVWVEDYFEGLSPGDDYRIAFDRAIAAARSRGRSRVRIETVIETKSTIVLPSGMSIVGDGKHYYYAGANFFEGAWIRYRGLAANPALRYGSVFDCGLTEVGIDCRDPDDGRTAISIGSDNNPATKELLFERFIIFGCGTGVKWGDENAATPFEQCDAITFREGTLHSCIDGFHIDAANAADYSLIERVGFGQLQGTAFKMPGAGFMPIRQCAAGMLYDTSTMFEISGLGPDAMIIEGCQSEGHPGSTFLKVTGTNDERIINLRNNQINQKIEVTGIHRILAVGNYLNSTVALDGYTRWTGEANGWLGALETPQVTLANGARFTDRVQRDAGGQNGRWIPQGMAIEQIPTAGGWKYQGAVRGGILGFTFVPTAEYAAGMYILPTVDNTYAYKCTVGGATGAEPAWPTVVGNTVTSGAATFQCIGAGALMKGMEGIQA